MQFVVEGVLIDILCEINMIHIGNLVCLLIHYHVDLIILVVIGILAFVVLNELLKYDLFDEIVVLLCLGFGLYLGALALISIILAFAVV